jgi:hypothetical protein
MAEILIAPATSSESGGDIIRKTEDQILRAVNELIRRACSGGDADPRIIDRKEEIAAMRQGSVQDCEFGLVILTVHDWFDKRHRLGEELPNRERVKTLVISLVHRTLKRIAATNSLDFRGGDVKGSPVFFSGEPYTWFRYRGNDAFSANLDAAMLTIAFLASALKEFDQELSAIEFSDSEEMANNAVKTLRDAALLACTEGLRYANLCRVGGQDRFEGYTCDPASNVPGDPPGSIEEFDRLFFSWTTCETIHELSNWSSYLTSVEKTGSAPAFLRETRELLENLKRDLKRSSGWCRQTFLERFRSLEAPPVGRIVGEFAKLGDNEAPSPVLDRERERLAEYVTHIYHLSQYAAIRSIEPLVESQNISINEVRDVVTLLDTAVGQHVLSSGLDTSTHPKLFQTLTRYYSLGVSNKEPYKDDAYFPLVVRSLSSLLARTISTLGTLGTRDEVATLVFEFRRSLKSRYESLIERRPEPVEQGDEVLWSYAVGGPYVLYATQRTIFALIEYIKFIEAMEEFEKSVSRPASLESIEAEMRDLLARSLVDVLINPVLAQFLKSASYLRQEPPGMSSHPISDGQLTLPEPDWARDVIVSWLRDFTEEFQKEKIREKLSQFAAQLSRLRDTFRKRRPSKPGAQIEKAHAGLKEAIEGIFSLPEIGPKLRALDAGDRSWEAEILLPILFEHMFREFTKSGRSLAELATIEGNDICKQIDEAQSFVGIISKAN